MPLQIGLPRQIDEKACKARDCSLFVFLDIGVVLGSLHASAEDTPGTGEVCSVFQCSVLASVHMINSMDLLAWLEMHFSPF